MQQSGDDVAPAATAGTYAHTEPVQIGSAHGGVAVGGTSTGVVQPAAADHSVTVTSPSNEEFMRAIRGFLEARPPANVDSSNTGAVHCSGDHVEGGTEGISPFDGNGTSTSDVNSLDQRPSNLRSMSATPSLTHETESRSPSNDPSTPLPDSYGVGVQDQPAGMIDFNTPDNRKALEALEATIRAHNAASAVNDNDIFPAVIIRNGERYHPYRKPQAAATSADLSAHNIESTDAALTGGVQSDGAGGTTSARNRAAQIVAVPSIVPSHTHNVEGASTTNPPAQVRTGEWKNAELEKDLPQIATDALDAMAFGRGDLLKCSYAEYVYDIAGNPTVRHCGMVFGTNTLRDRHAKSVHLSTLIRVCKVCKRTLSRQDALLRHINYKKPGCKICQEWKERHGELWLKAELLQKYGYEFKD